MKIFPIGDAVAGEQLLAVEPQLARYAEVDWRQRLEYFTGRALTHTALRLEQRGRAGHLATLGQTLSPGVVSGLEAVAAQTAESVVIEISAGMGLATSGEIINLNRNHQVLLDDIRVYAPASLLDSAGDSSSRQGAYKLGDTLAELRAQEVPLPQALVLLLQPVAVEHFGQEESTDPCDYDPSDEAFENWQWLDGFRLVLYTWPVSLGPLPVAGAWRRNRIAHAIFEGERYLSEGENLPWFDLGVPVALIGLDGALEFDFLDSNAVVRRGAEPKGGEVPISPAGNRFMWQARFEQFNEQLVDWLTTNTSTDPSQIRAEMEFRHLPPVGVLPKESMSPRQQLQRFFPMSYSVRALAVPYEQLDLAIEESAGLLAYDINTPDRVEVLVPVPQQYYEPQLLVVESIDPVFNQTISRFTILRDEWLGRRLIVRNKASTIYKAIKGRPLLYRVDDPNAIDTLEQPLEYEQTLVNTGDSCSYLKGTAEPPLNWFQQSFDDSAWLTGVTAIGYGRAGLGTALDDMQGRYVTLLLRHSFTLATLAESHRYTLVVTTNGGFYAWLNGRYLSSANVSRPLFNSPAQQPQTLEPRRYQLGELTGRLLAGDNVLAIQAHNVSLAEGKFSISIELLDTEDDFGTVETVQMRVDKMSIPFGKERYKVSGLEDLRSYLDTSTPLSDAEIARLDEIGIEEYIGFLQRKIDRADDRVEFGFLRLRTDIYRVRQMMLGNEAGTKLATSPALAEIAKGDSAVATREELTSFYQRLKQAPKDGDTVTSPDTGGDGSPVVGVTAAPGTTDRLTDKVFFSGELVTGDLSGITDRGKVVLDKDSTTTTVPGIETDIRKRTIAELERSSPVLLKFATTASIEDVGQQSPIIGMVQSFNNATVGERLEEASANIAYQAGLAVNGELITDLLGPADTNSPEFIDNYINIDDLSVPGVAEEQDGELKLLKFSEIRDSEEVQQKLRSGGYYPVSNDDEAGHFNAGIRALENVVGVLRLIEGRVHAYRQAVARCKSTIVQLQADLEKADLRLKTIGTELAEARHDVSVARSLKAEEEARIAALNAQRDKVLETLVPFLLFRRPRTVGPRLDAPIHYLNPDLSGQPLPLCDVSEVEVPDALEAILDVVREAPLKWFAAVHLILPRLSRLEDLHVTLSGAKKRATSKVTVHPFLKRAGSAGSDKLLLGLSTALTKSQQRIQLERRKTTAIDLGEFQRMGWQESIKRVPEVVSLGDLIDGNHGRFAASRRAADEMAMFAKVSSCLYLRFSGVPATIRLDWAERMSQYDAPVNLRNLYSLPRFGEMEYIERHNMQRLVDWLYSRIVSDYDEAQDIVSDLIRVVLLSASHAPVNQLIAGYLPAPVTVRPGSRINVVVDLTRVRVGMAVSMVSAGDTLVRGRVADISGGEVTAEVHTLVGTSVQLATGTRVQIGERLGMMC